MALRFIFNYSIIIRVLLDQIYVAEEKFPCYINRRDVLRKLVAYM